MAVAPWAVRRGPCAVGRAVRQRPVAASDGSDYLVRGSLVSGGPAGGAAVIKARDAKALEQGDARSEMEGWSEIFQKKNKILPQVNHPAVLVCSGCLTKIP